MSIQTEIDRIQNNVANTYAALEALGCDIPEEQNSDNLSATAGTSKVVLYTKQTLTEEQKAQVRENIGVLSEETTTTEGLPDYWKTAVDAMKDNILTQLDEGGRNAFGFVWGADIHGTSGYTNPSNGAGTSVTKNIGYIAQYATEVYDLPFVMFSGDIMSQASHSVESNVHTEHENMWKLFSPIDKEKLLLEKGNHDGAYGAAVDGVYYLYNIGGKEIYNNLFRRQALDRTRVFGGDGSYFYVDTPNNMRVIMLNGHTDGDGSVDENGYAVYNSMKYGVYGTEQLKWLSDVALNVPDGMRVILSAHQPFTNSVDGSLLAGILNAYNNRTTYSDSKSFAYPYWGGGVETDYTTSSCDVDFTNATGKVVAYFHGHIHYDSIDTTSHTFVTASITTAGADVRDTNPSLRTAGTATETALDVVVITDDKIYFNRLGAGSDRTIDLKNGGVISGDYTNIIDTVGYEDGVRLNSSGTTTELEGYTATGMIDISAYEDPVTIRTKGVNFIYSTSCYLVAYNADGSLLTHNPLKALVGNDTEWNGILVTADDEGNITITTTKSSAPDYFRIAGYGSGANLIVTVNEEIV